MKETLFLPYGKKILSYDHGRHISRKRYIILCFRIKRVYAKSVRVGICRKNYIRIFLFCKLKRQCKGFGILRIRILKRSKIGIRIFLFLNYIHMLKSQFGKDAPYRNISRSVKWCINYSEIIGNSLYSPVIKAYTTHSRNIFVIHLITDYMKKIIYTRFHLRHKLYIRQTLNLFDLFNNLCIMRRRHLSAVLPVNLIAVVLRRVMAGRDHDAGNSPCLPYRK